MQAWAFSATCGDVNSSGSVDIVDALVTAQYYVGLNPASYDQSVADVNGDGSVTIVDALLVAQYYVGLISSFPGCNQTPAPTGSGTILVVDFNDRPSANTALTGMYANVDWGSSDWMTGGGVLWLDNSSTTGQSRTIAIPAGYILQSMLIHVYTSGQTATVIVSSAGNQTVTWSVTNASFATFSTGWGVASSSVTITITSAAGAYDVDFDDFTFSTTPGATGGPTQESTPVSTEGPTPEPTSAPTQPPTGALSYIVTSVNDNLDATDRTDMANGLRGLGYTAAADNSNVNRAAMKNYFQQNITLLYHTGHGSEGEFGVADGAITVNDGPINVQNTIFATCNTLISTQWKSAFGQTAQCIMGYTNLSYDFTDNDVVKSYTKELGNKRSHPYAWYLSNNSQSLLKDRWCMYLRESDGINEYSARSGKIPPTTKSSVTDLVSFDADGKLYAVPEILAAKSTGSSRGSRILITGSVDVRSDIQGETFEDILGTVNFTADDAVNLVKALVPADAALDDVISIGFRADSIREASTVGYIVRYVRTIDGLEVRGTGSEIHLSYMVGPQYTIVGTSSCWPQIAKEKASPVSMLTVQDALKKAAPVISAHIKGQSLVIEKASQVYGCYSMGSGKTELVPAYAFTTADGVILVVDAVSGELVE